MQVTESCRIRPGLPGALAAALLAAFAATASRAAEAWHLTPGVGVLSLAGSDPARAAGIGALRLGYDLDAPVSLELGGLAGCSENRRDAADTGWHNLYGVWADAIVHLRRWERFDPFLSLGAGYLWSDGRALPDRRQEIVTPRLGAGFLYSLSDAWSVRAGVSLMAAHPADRRTVGCLFEFGLSYYFGDTTPARPDLAN
jgi:hypothetical protein